MIGRHDGGSAIIELAVTAPFLAVLVLGGIEIGRYSYQGIELGNAARAGAQYAAQSMLVSTDTAGMASAAIADAKELSLTPASIAASTYCACDSAQSVTVSCGGPSVCSLGDREDVFVKVVVTKHFTPLVRFPGLPGAITLSRTATRQVSP